jgi:hypothetical protein
VIEVPDVRQVHVIGGWINENAIKGANWIGDSTGGFHLVTYCRTGEESREGRKGREV